MEYLIAGLLSFCASFWIILYIWSKRKFSYKPKMHRQTDTQKFFKSVVKSSDKPKKMTQALKREEESSTKLIITEDDRAYWVLNNIFYTTDVRNGIPDFNSAIPVDTSNMSKDELDKMLYILDNLGRGEKDERNSPGNK